MAEKQTRILVVDDEAAIRRLLVRLLNGNGYNVDSAENAGVARKMLEGGHYDLALVDINMPGERGDSLIRHITANYPQTGVVVISGMSDQGRAREIVAMGVYGYLVKPVERDSLLIQVQIALNHLRLDLEMQRYQGALEKTTRQQGAKLTTLMNSIPLGIYLVDTEMRLIDYNDRIATWYPQTTGFIGKQCHTIFCRGERKESCPMAEVFSTGKSIETEMKLNICDGLRDFRVIYSPVHDGADAIVAGVAILEDITIRLQLEDERQQSGRLEALGQLAAGIVHEINSPVQFVSDNLDFLRTSFDDLSTLTATLIDLDNREKEAEQRAVLRKAALEEADHDFLLEEIPSAVSQSIEGLARVAGIVRALKKFSHPGGEEKSPVDINTILENTSVISKNEWKYVAELECDLQQGLPLISCYPGELDQVILNLIVNAAHALAEKGQESPGWMGTIRLSSRAREDGVRLTIEDNGNGIPKEIQAKVFDSFFTTKERGRGTGQGLAIARGVVVDRHGGEISFTSKPGGGTTFVIDLPSGKEVS